MAESARISGSIQQPLLENSETVEIPMQKPETLPIEEVFSLLKTDIKPSCQTMQISLFINALTVSDDEKTLVGGSTTGEVIIWDLKDKNKPPLRCNMGQTSVNTVICSKSNIIYAGNEGGKLLCWDFSNNYSKEFRDPRFGITALGLLNNKNLISVSKNGLLEVWDSKFNLIHSDDSHTDEINCLKISKNEKQIYTGNSDFTIGIWNEEFDEVQQLPDNHKSAVVVLELFDDILVSGDYSGRLIVWNLEDFDVIYQVELEHAIRSIVKSPDNRYLFTVIEDTEKIQIKIWNMSNLTEDKPFAIKTAHVGSINCMHCMGSSGRLVTSGQEKTIKIWDFDQHSTETQILEVEAIECMLVTADQVVYSKNAEVHFLNLQGLQQKSLRLKPNIRNMALDSQSAYLAHDSTENLVYVWHLVLNTQPYAQLPHPSPVTCMIFAKNQRLITGSADKTIRIWNLIMKKLHYIYLDTQSITDIKCLDDYLYAANAEGVITLWETTGNRSTIKKFEYKSKVLSIDISENHVLVAGGELGILKIWRWKDAKLAKVEEDSEKTRNEIKPKELPGHKKPVFKVIVNKGKIFSASFDRTIKIWSIDLRMLYYSIDLSCNITGFWASESTEIFYFMNPCGIFQVKNPLRSSEISVYPQKYSWVFLQYLKKLSLNKIKSFDEYWKDYAIFPHIVNVLFILIKANQPELLKKAIASGAKFLQEQNGESPLSAALSWKNNICADVILKSLSKMKLHKEHGILESIENCMNKVINSNLSQLPKLFESLFPVTTNNLSLYAKLRHKPPMILESGSKNIHDERFIDESGNKTEQIEFRRSICRFDFVMGSQESLQLLRAISHSNNADFFRTSLLKSILKYKWSKVYYLLLGEFIVYGVMLLLVSLLTIHAYDTAVAVVLFVLNIGMLAKECVQVVESIRKYVRDFWNFLDLARITCTFVYLGFCWSGEESIALSQILTILYWIRAVTYFRIFDKTRYLIRMIIETFVDIVPFLLIFFTATLTFALLFFIATKSESFSETFVMAYQLNFNDFSGFLTDGYAEGLSSIFWCVFFISSIMNPIILLNLLIAIMSDTYDRVQEDQVVADCKEMAGLIIQAEGMLFWRRKLVNQAYLQRCDYTRNLLNDSAEWMGKIRAIKKSITRLQVKSRNNDKKLDKMQSRVLFKIKEIKGINEQIAKRITEMEGTSSDNKSSSSFII